MTDRIQHELDRLRQLGRPDELRRLAEKEPFHPGYLKTNAHIHLPPNFSAFVSVAQAVELAADQGVCVLGASNYYDFTVYADFAALARRHGVFPLFGLEIIALLEDLQRAGVLVNDPGNPGRMYICGKGIVRFGSMTATAKELMHRIRQNDSARMRSMVDRMEAIFISQGVETGLNEAAIIDRIERRLGVERGAICLQERHVAQVFQESFFDRVPPAERLEKLNRVLGVASRAGPEDHVMVQHEVRAHLMKVGKPAFVPEAFLNFDQSYRLVLELGGIPCYPTLADGASPICAFEDPPEKLIESMMQNRIYCAEFIPIRNKPGILEHYVRAAREAGLVITAGTEHNTLDLIPLEPRCIGGAPVPEIIRDIFWEGACVVAAHQFLALHGHCGYVDGAGTLNPDFATGEQRIEYFRRLGAAVIRRYHEQSAV